MLFDFHTFYQFFTSLSLVVPEKTSHDTFCSTTVVDCRSTNIAQFLRTKQINLLSTGNLNGDLFFNNVDLFRRLNIQQALQWNTLLMNIQRLLLGKKKKKTKHGHSFTTDLRGTSEKDKSEKGLIFPFAVLSFGCFPLRFPPYPTAYKLEKAVNLVNCERLFFYGKDICLGCINHVKRLNLLTIPRALHLLPETLQFCRDWKQSEPLAFCFDLNID